VLEAEKVLDVFYSSFCSIRIFMSVANPDDRRLRHLLKADASSYIGCLHAYNA